VIEHLLAQRACRAYTADPVSDEHLAMILQAATHAPSAENRQPWVFVVVRDAATRAAIDGLTRRLWEGGARHHAERNLAPGLFATVDRFMAEGYGGAPLLVVAAGDGRDGLPPAVLASSLFPAVQNLLLAAAALGYGSALTTLAAQHPDALGAAVGLPEGVRPLAVVPLGRPAAPLGRPRRRQVGEVAHLDRYGSPFGGVSGPAAPPPPAPPPA
jgi:nitroreductase